MRTARIKADGTGYYHAMSRAIEGRFIFGPRERERFLNTMRKLEGFCGLEILTYSVLSSHFHILIKVPKQTRITDAELIRRLEILYKRPYAQTIEAALRDLRKQGSVVAAEQLRRKYTYRMNDLSQFMKSLKQSFSQYYNKTHDRKGTLWESRFKSLLIEGSEHALSTVAAYIDLNAVRAGMVKDPKEYRWCGDGAAMGGCKTARKGLGLIISGLGVEGSWSKVSGAYREYLYLQGREKGIGPDGKPLRRGFSEEQVKAVLESGGRLSQQEILRCRVRYFSDGLVLGSKEFVEETFTRYRHEFGLKRETGARAMEYGEWNGLATMRDLRQAVIIVPAS